MNLLKAMLRMDRSISNEDRMRRVEEVMLDVRRGKLIVIDMISKNQASNLFLVELEKSREYFNWNTIVEYKRFKWW
jgi:hypothetical protein